MKVSFWCCQHSTVQRDSPQKERTMSHSEKKTTEESTSGQTNAGNYLPNKSNSAFTSRWFPFTFGSSRTTSGALEVPPPPSSPSLSDDMDEIMKSVVSEALGDKVLTEIPNRDDSKASLQQFQARSPDNIDKGNSSLRCLVETPHPQLESLYIDGKKVTIISDELQVFVIDLLSKESCDR